MIFAVLATGPSMSQSIADAVRDRCRVVAVSDAYRLAAGGDAIVSTDFSWWRHHPEAAKMPVKKFGGFVEHQKIDGVEALLGENATNSGLLGIKVAVKLGATKVLLCGFDMHSPGKHFFGRHGGSLRSTSLHRMDAFKRQFERYQPAGVSIINCTPGSALHAYPKADLNACLAELEAHELGAL